MKTGNVPTTNGGTLTLDQAARAAVAGMGHVFADPAIEGQQAFVTALTTLLTDVHETLTSGGWLTPHEVRDQARTLVKTLKRHLYDADLWGSTETTTAVIQRLVERAVASAIRLVITDFTANAVIAHER